jgi:hypothetical protein
MEAELLLGAAYTFKINAAIEHDREELVADLVRDYEEEMSVAARPVTRT